MKRRNWICCQLAALLMCAFTVGSEAAWIEGFETGLGRFEYAEEEGDSVFMWNVTEESLDATFIRRTPADKRYALIPTVENVHTVRFGFSTEITISGEVPGRESDPACANFGFFNSADSDLFGFLLVEAIITRPSEDIKHFILKARERTTETLIQTVDSIPFEFGVTYFIDALVIGSEHVFKADFYEGADATGSYLGTLTLDIDPSYAIGFDALGFTGWGDSQHTVVQANFDNFAFVPEPSTFLLTGCGILSLKRKRREP